MATKHQSIIRMYFNSAGVAVNPGGGGAYAESIANIRSKVAFERLLDEYARVVVTAQGNGLVRAKASRFTMLPVQPKSVKLRGPVMPCKQRWQAHGQPVTLQPIALLQSE